MKRTLFLFLIGLYGCHPFLPLKNPFTDIGTIAGSGGSPGGKTLEIDILDVGQGDATLVRGPSGKTILIDAGKRDMGVEKVLPDFAALNVHHLDWIVATHYDADHIGGIAEVLMGADQVLGTDDDWIPREAMIDRGDFTEKATATYDDYVAIAAPYRQEAEPGMIFDLGDGAVAEVVVVNGRYEDGRTISLQPDEENEACIGLLIAYGNFRYFTAGDLTGGGAPGGYETKDLETIAGEIIGDIDVLHVGHHGSSSSTNETFLEKTMPEEAIISVGKENDYGHPTEEVLTRLEKAGAAIYRTDQMGTIEIQTDGNGYDVKPLE